MSLPIDLQYGFVAVYGLGTQTGVSGIVPTDTNWMFGNIEQISNYGINMQMAGAYVGCHVIFREQDAQLAIKYNDWPYTIIEQNKLAGLTEQDIPPPP
jgi:hypothetical protein